MFKKNTAVTGFGIGNFINTTTKATVTTGTPTCKRTIDGTAGSCANAAAYDATGLTWKIDLAAGDLNGDMIVLSFTLADCFPISYTIKTVTKLVSDLNDAAAVSAETIADAVWDEASTGHTDAGKAGQQLWTDVDAILADTNELQTDWTNGGRLDLLIDEITGYVDCLPASWVTPLAATSYPTNFSSLSINGSGYVTYANTAPLDASGVRTAIGLATANLDTQLADLPTVAEFNARTLLAADYVVTSDTIDANLVTWKGTIPLDLSSQKVQAEASVALSADDIADIADAVAAAVSLTGDGSVSVGWNYGGMTAYATSGGVPINNATVKAYLKSDYESYNRGTAYVQGETTTDVNGKFEDNLMLDPGAYIIVWYKQGEYGPNTAEITVTE